MISNLNHKNSGDRDASSLTLELQALSYLQKKGDALVPELYVALRLNNPSLSEDDLTDLVWRLVREKKADVEDAPLTVSSLWGYLRIWERNLWFYAALAASLGTVLVIYLVPSQFPLVVLRWILGSLFVLFIPGYVAIEALFPEGRDLEGIERFALSVGLSLASVPLIGLLLNYTPWGIRLNPIVISLTAFTLTLAVVALARKYRISVAVTETDNLK